MRYEIILAIPVMLLLATAIVSSSREKCEAKSVREKNKKELDKIASLYKEFRTLLARVEKLDIKGDSCFNGDIGVQYEFAKSIGFFFAQMRERNDLACLDAAKIIRMQLDNDKWIERLGHYIAYLEKFLPFEEYFARAFERSDLGCFRGLRGV